MAFPIQPLNLPDAIRPAQFNFATAFGGLGDAIAEARSRQALNSAIAGATDAQGNLDYGKAGAALAQAGMVDQARPLLALALQKQAADRAEAGQAETRRHNLAVEGIAGQKVAQGPVDLAKRFGKAPSGYRFTESGELEPIPGGPQAHKFEVSVAGELTDAAAKRIAEQFLAGDQSSLTGLRTNPKNFAKVQNEIARQAGEAGTSGLDQAIRSAEFMGQKRYQSTLGQRSAAIDLPATEFQQMAPIVLEQSKNYPRTDYPTLNSLINAFQTGTGDPRAIQLGQSLFALENIYARAISPTGVATVDSHREARANLNKAFANGQIEGVVGLMGQEIGAMKQSPAKVRDEMRQRFREGFTGKSEAPPPATAPAQAAPAVPPPAPVPLSGSGMTSERVNQIMPAALAKARAFVAQGANKADVLRALNDQLRAAGIPPISDF